MAGLAGMPFPRISRNLGEKGEGTQGARAKKSNGEMAPGTRRPTPTLGKPSGKLSTGTSKEAKSCATPIIFPWGKQDTTYDYRLLEGGSQEHSLVHNVPPQADTQTILSGKLGADREGKMHPDDVSKEKDSLLNCLQAPEILDAPEIVLPEGEKDPSRSSEYAEKHTLWGKWSTRI
ncbi:hypothetical protein NDU88_005731 [Pleurodeles waltl]|uniref:Uncharacterized protein n=1 Tax=Pleurodeles waltl TaxID=8319 RepID=A0AAV7MAA1_PLEWA|nr:hypothetical protein NDU88_005731 [Pleurodeles waltl]